RVGCGDGPDTWQRGVPSPQVCDGANNDCDGTTDEDYAPQPTPWSVGACARTGETVCVEGHVLDSCLPGVPSAEVCDGADNDCDGTTDEDYVPQPTSCGVGACARTGETACVEGHVLDSCLPGVPTAEVCDGADNDCDGTTDEDYVPLPTSCGVGACARTVASRRSAELVLDSCLPGVPSAEVCDGADNDCDGTTDEDYVPEPTSC